MLFKKNIFTLAFYCSKCQKIEQLSEQLFLFLNNLPLILDSNPLDSDEKITLGGDKLRMYLTIVAVTFLSLSSNSSP